MGLSGAIHSCSQPIGSVGYCSERAKIPGTWIYFCYHLICFPFSLQPLVLLRHQFFSLLFCNVLLFSVSSQNRLLSRAQWGCNILRRSHLMSYLRFCVRGTHQRHPVILYLRRFFRRCRRSVLQYHGFRTLPTQSNRMVFLLRPANPCDYPQEAQECLPPLRPGSQSHPSSVDVWEASHLLPAAAPKYKKTDATADDRLLSVVAIASWLTEREAFMASCSGFSGVVWINRLCLQREVAPLKHQPSHLAHLNELLPSYCSSAYADCSTHLDPKPSLRRYQLRHQRELFSCLTKLKSRFF